MGWGVGVADLQVCTLMLAAKRGTSTDDVERRSKTVIWKQQQIQP